MPQTTTGGSDDVAEETAGAMGGFQGIERGGEVTRSRGRSRGPSWATVLIVGVPVWFAALTGCGEEKVAPQETPSVGTTAGTGGSVQPTTRVTPAVPNLPPPPESVLADQKALADLPQGFVRDEVGRIWCEKDGAEMVLVPEGEFVMGSVDGGLDEKPVHRVFLSAFLVDRHEVTVGQFKKFCLATGKAMPDQVLESTDRHPVVNVDWSDAKVYAEWAGRRLPTEAEWEKAARGTDGRVYAWGNADDERRRNGRGSGDGFSGPAPVGSYASGASPCGALDMAGDVWEWCADWYDEKYYRTPVATVRDPQGAASGSYRVARGGAWMLPNNPYLLRCPYRNRYAPLVHGGDIGFRCARGLPQGR